MVEEANCDHSKLRPQLCTERKTWRLALLPRAAVVVCRPAACRPMASIIGIERYNHTVAYSIDCRSARGGEDNTNSLPLLAYHRQALRSTGRLDWK
eukprot:scaffold311531_cov60-Attheya_sp.AAC.2